MLTIVVFYSILMGNKKSTFSKGIGRHIAQPQIKEWGHGREYQEFFACR